jgi:hypothetical protein
MNVRKKLSRLTLKLHRKKPEATTKWNTPTPTTPQPDKPKIEFAPPPQPSTRNKLFKPLSFKPEKVWHFTILRTFNRFLAAFIFFFNFIFFLGTIGQSNVVWFSVLFFLNAYVCLKYLWQSKKVKIEFET